MYPSTRQMLALAAILQSFAVAAPATGVEQLACFNSTHYTDTWVNEGQTALACPPSVLCTCTQAVAWNPCGYSCSTDPSGVPGSAPVVDGYGSSTSTGTDKGVVKLADVTRTGTQQNAAVKTSSGSDADEGVSTETGTLSANVAASTSPTNSPNGPPLVDGNVVGAWIAPWDDWSNANLQGVTDLFVGFVNITQGNVNFADWASGSFLPTSQKIEGLKDAQGSTIKRVWAAFGGWGQEPGFQQNSATAELRKAFAQGVANFMQANPVFDGIDIDWEFPVDGGEHYKNRPRDESEAVTFPLLLEALVQANPGKYVAIDVPGRPADKAGAKYNLPAIVQHVSMINVMAYDICNRRDTTFVHHASESGAEKAVESYISDGVPRYQITVGFPMFGKVFKTTGACATGGPANLVGCDLAVMEDAKTGDAIPDASAQIRFLGGGNNLFLNTTWYNDFSAAFGDDTTTYDSAAMANAKYVNGYVYSWQGSQAMKASCTTLMGKGYKGGFAYAYGQDTTDMPRWKAYMDCMTGGSS